MPLRCCTLELSREANRTVVRLPDCHPCDDRHTMSLHDQFSAVEELVAHLPGQHLTLDLGQVEVLTSTVLGRLIGLQRRLQARGGRLVLANLRPAVRQICAATRLDTLLEIRPDAGASPGRALSA
jgi:anti-anti-sigma factor